MLLSHFYPTLRHNDIVVSIRRWDEWLSYGFTSPVRHGLAIPANLLVVNPLVAFYKPMRGQSTAILPRTGPTHPRLTEEAQVQPGGYD